MMHDASSINNNIWACFMSVCGKRQRLQIQHASACSSLPPALAGGLANTLGPFQHTLARFLSRLQPFLTAANFSLDYSVRLSGLIRCQNHAGRFMRLGLILIIGCLLNGCVLGLAVDAVHQGIWGYQNYIVVEKHEAKPVEGQDFTIDCGQGRMMKFIWIKELSMWFGEYEVTLGDYDHYDSEDSQYNRIKTWPGFTERFPANNIQVIGAEGFCSYLNRHVPFKPEGRYVFRLPTEDEWERAARCGNDRLYPWGDAWPPHRMSDGNFPNLCGDDINESPYVLAHPDDPLFRIRPADRRIPGYHDGFIGPCPVEKSGRNEYGLYGMAGNASEWCLRPDGTSVLKGGSWYDFVPEQLEISYAEELKSKSWPFFPIFQDRRSHFGTGFRVVVGKPQ